MNYIKHLTFFFDKVINDETLNPTHISLYVSLFQFWNINRFQNPISISRHEVMRVSKICSKATYHKCMKDLHNLGYLKYAPSYNPFKGSLVYLLDFAPDQLPVQKTDKKCSKKQASSGTGTEQALVPYINSINISNNKIFSSENLQTQFSENENMPFSEIDTPKTDNEQIAKRKKVAKKKEKDFVCPTLDEAVAFFKSENFTELDARKFFNHFESNGWRVGGKTPMKNWQAAARNWMINASRFAPPQAPKGKPNPNGKNYSEPL